MIRRLLWAVATFAACAPQSTPSWPSTPLASESCTSTTTEIGPIEVRWSDLDVGDVCTVVFEQDRCIAGVFRDCSNLREWQGRFSGAELRLQSLGDDAALCCRGTVFERPHPSARLVCSTEGCGGTENHGGLYFEAGPFQPAGKISSEILAPGTILAVSDGFVLAEDGDSNPTVYRIETMQAVRTLAGGRLLSMDWVASDSAVLGPLGQFALPEAPVAFSANEKEAWVATENFLVHVDDNGQSQFPLPDASQVRSILPTADGSRLLTDRAFLNFGDGNFARQPIEGLFDGAQHLQQLEPWTVLSGRCHRRSDRRMCVLAQIGEETVARVGIPDVIALGPAVAAGGNWWFSTGTGTVAVVDPFRQRPLLRGFFALPAPVQLAKLKAETFVAVEIGGRRLWTLEAIEGTW